MNIVLGGLTFINDSPAQPNYEFQKLSIMHTWYKTSQTMDDLEHNLLKAGPNLKQILDHWTGIKLIIIVFYVKLTIGLENANKKNLEINFTKKF